MGTYKKEDYLFGGAVIFPWWNDINDYQWVVVNQGKDVDIPSKENTMFRVHVTGKSSIYSEDHKKFTMVGVKKAS